MQAAEINAGTGSQVEKSVNPGAKLHARALRPGPSSWGWKTYHLPFSVWGGMEGEWRGCLTRLNSCKPHPTPLPAHNLVPRGWVWLDLVRSDCVWSGMFWFGLVGSG